MIVPYNKKRLKLNLYLAVVWLMLGIFQMFLMKDQPWLGLGWIALSMIYLAIFIYRKKNHYITISPEFVKQNWPFGKKLRVVEIVDIRYFSQDYIVKTNSEELRINTNLIDEASLDALKDMLLNINVNKK